MTVERRLVVSLGDIKAVVFECRECGGRYSVSPDNAEMPDACPQGHVWRFAPVAVKMMGSPLERLVNSISDARRQLADPKPPAGCRVLLEFEEPPR